MEFNKDMLDMMTNLVTKGTADIKAFQDKVAAQLKLIEDKEKKPARVAGLPVTAGINSFGHVRLEFENPEAAKAWYDSLEKREA